MVEGFYTLMGGLIAMNIIIAVRVMQMFIEYEKLKRE